LLFLLTRTIFHALSTDEEPFLLQKIQEDYENEVKSQRKQSQLKWEEERKRLLQASKKLQTGFKISTKED